MKDNPNCDNSNADCKLRITYHNVTNNLLKMLAFKNNFSKKMFSDEYMSIESPEQSEDFNSTELNFGADDYSPNKKSTSETNMKDIIVENTKSVAIVNHGMIVSAKTNTVERVIIPEKESRCCIIL